ncbi:MAG: GAF domain-containing protein [Oscillochloridaceae bacterium]|nr:GAF domain-containing protein [Chloroflexaceae bacterium]MDW8392224.1 GAF domain-containing protein [Oscillochloridaceae bacterium]
MLLRETRFQRFVQAMQRADQLAIASVLEDLYGQMLELMVLATEAEAGVLSLYDEHTQTLTIQAVTGLPGAQRLLAARGAASQGLAGAVLRQGKALFVADATRRDTLRDWICNAAASLPLRTIHCQPLMSQGRPLGCIHVFNLPDTLSEESEELALINLLGSRLVNEIEKQRILAQAQRRERRQQALLEIVSHLTTTLDRDELLNRIMSRACELLDVEATSIWLRDPNRDDLVLHIAAGTTRERIVAQRVPAGQGIIGHVVATGETVAVNDVSRDPRFYRQVDASSGFVTRSILCVPLKAPRIQLGDARGIVEERIIGGAQALNPRDGMGFALEDIALFETLASQAATVIRLAELYTEVSALSTRIIDAITGAIDLKDPYTRGHSQRVSDFSVAIAQELGLSPDEVYRVRIASKLHDVGKIRVPDRILKKRRRLSDSEFAEMRQHPVYGLEFLRENGLLELEVLRDSWTALSQHHERLDGRGYPNGLSGDQISLVGRIVAVADVFDAITSHRPYQPARSAEEAIAILRGLAGVEFDGECVEALVRARARGLIHTQEERGERQPPSKRRRATRCGSAAMAG